MAQVEEPLRIMAVGRASARHHRARRAGRWPSTPGVAISSWLSP